MQRLSFSILLPVHSPNRMLTHGDYFFGRSLVRALGKLGHQTKIFAQKDWDKTGAEDIAIIIRGRAAPTRSLGRLMLEWCISYPPKLAEGDFEHIDHFFAASPFLAKRISRRCPDSKVSIMYQAFDPEIMFPSEKDHAKDLVFVGVPRSVDRRPVVSFAAQSGLPTRIWGDGWEDTPFGHLQVGGTVNNDELGALYRSGAVVLNDHLFSMKRNQLVSNRVYDGLACGKAVLSDTKAGLAPDLAKHVYEYSDAKTFKKQALRALSEPDERRLARIELSKQMVAAHSFDARAHQICKLVQKLLMERVS